MVEEMGRIRERREAEQLIADNFEEQRLAGQEKFLKSVIERSSPANARLVAELFHGLDLGHAPNTVVRVGGAATLCHHQNPCYDKTCDLCYDPLLQQHGLCGGGSYYTCAGSLPSVCMPRGDGEERCHNSPGIFGRSPRNQLTDMYHMEREPILVKQFSRHMDYFCLGHLGGGGKHSPDSTSPMLAEGVLEVGAGVSVCQKYDKCLDMSCAHRPVACYDAYIGAHVACGDLSHYQCQELLPRDCLPVRCTETSVKQIFKEFCLKWTLHLPPAPSPRHFLHGYLGRKHGGDFGKKSTAFSEELSANLRQIQNVPIKLSCSNNVVLTLFLTPPSKLYIIV